MCGAKSVLWLPKLNRWQCSKGHAKRQFTAKTGTIFEDSKLGLDKWLIAMWLILNCKNGISSYELSRALDVTQKTAWFMNHRIRTAMKEGTLEKMSGPVEADETFVGGSIENMHPRRRKQIGREKRGGKTIVMGLIEREGQVRTRVVGDTYMRTLEAVLKENVVQGATVFTDEFPAYARLKHYFSHEFVNHMERYVAGQVHTNSIENFWSLLKRSIKGTYVSVEPFHLHKYCDEQAFRYNTRKAKDGERLSLAVSRVTGRRLTYAELTGKVVSSQPQA
jgi:transposase-like protein